MYCLASGVFSQYYVCEMHSSLCTKGPRKGTSLLTVYISVGWEFIRQQCSQSTQDAYQHSAFVSICSHLTEVIQREVGEFTF